MARKKQKKSYWEMTTAELREATKQFDEEFVAEKSRPLIKCRGRENLGRD